MSFENAEIGQCPSLAPLLPLPYPTEEAEKEEEEASKPHRPAPTPAVVTSPPELPAVSDPPANIYTSIYTHINE